MGLFDTLFRTPKDKRQNIEAWQTNGTDFYSLLVESDSTSRDFTLKIVGSTIKHHSARIPSRGEVILTYCALKGMMMSSTSKSNGFLMGLIPLAFNAGQHVYIPGESDEIHLPVYSKMIKDYYTHFGGPDDEMKWFFIEQSYLSPEGLETRQGQPLWGILAECIQVLESLK